MCVHAYVCNVCTCVVSVVCVQYVRTLCVYANDSQVVKKVCLV